jgi:hypothetical protein
MKSIGCSFLNSRPHFLEFFARANDPTEGIPEATMRRGTPAVVSRKALEVLASADE